MTRTTLKIFPDLGAAHARAGLVRQVDRPGSNENPRRVRAGVPVGAGRRGLWT